MENDAISRAWLLEQLQDLGNTTLLKRNFIALVENAPGKSEPCRPDCRWRGRHQKCSCCRRNASMKDNYEKEAEHG